MRPVRHRCRHLPVGEIDNKVYGADETVTFPAGCTEIGPVMKKLRETLTGIQSGAVEDKHNWFTPSHKLPCMSGPRATYLSGASSDMKEPPLRTSCGGGSFVLRSAPER